MGSKILRKVYLFSLFTLGFGVETYRQHQADRPNGVSKGARPALAVQANVNKLPPNAEVFFDLPSGFKIEPDIDEKQPPLATGGKIVKIRQGPFTVAPGNQVESEKQWIAPAELPCVNCYITAIQGGLEFEDGSPAYVDSGAFLQHLFIHPTSSEDLVCRYWNLLRPNRLYATGNERETVRLNTNGQKYGIYVPDDEAFALRFNAINTGKKPITFYLTQKYEIVPRAAAVGYRNVTTAWIDVAGCGGTTTFSPTEGTWQLESEWWPSTVNGKILFTHGHVHEGGINTTLYVNTKPVCTSSQLYGRKATSIDPQGKSHISDNSICINVSDIKKGDKLLMEASYDSAKHAYDLSMTNNGFDTIMAINNVYIGVLS